MDIQHDGVITISVGKSRKETSWKNKELQWSGLLEKLSATHRTAETVAEYKLSKKPRQDEIKDIGGFVGGYIEGGRRKAGSILSRCLLSLDADHSPFGLWEDYTMLYGCAACMYSTHKHTPENPRLRLIIPLSREVTPDEYQALARKFASYFDIDVFDDTTYEPSRLMYWPSTPVDGEYLFKYNDGPWLNPDEVLGLYRNWRDSSQWPVSSRLNEYITNHAKKQGDPEEKPGVIGAFCRTYGIHEAIGTFLNDEYAACDVGDRYTYIGGSTSAGLVVYDDKFAYSHHGTDPVSGKLCNAFDLVRIHKYGLRDDNSKEDTPINKKPSYLAMEEFARTDKGVAALIAKEKIADAAVDFEGASEEELSWMEELETDKKGNYLSTYTNLELIINNDPRLKGCFADDLFSNRRCVLKALPWRDVDAESMFMTDTDEQNLRIYLSKKPWGIVAKDKITDALGAAFGKQAFHQLNTYLQPLTWDGVPRAETIFIDYLGVADTPLDRACTRLWLMGAVARALHPGTMFDYTIVLVGKQGVGKSKFAAKLAKKAPWFSDSFTIEGNAAYEGLRGKWIVEIAELAGIKKADMDDVKKFLTKTHDFYRAAFNKYPQDQPRSCVFIGSTNDISFLRDGTGNRRFWPMDVDSEQIKKSFRTELSDYEVDQIWAEAVHLYKQDGKLWLPDDLEARMEQRRSGFTEDDSRSGLIEQYLNTLLPDTWQGMDIAQRRLYLEGDELSPTGTVQRTEVCAAEIWCECLFNNKGSMKRYESKEIGAMVLRLPGWEKAEGLKRFSIYGPQRYFRTERKNMAEGAVTNCSKNEIVTDEAATIF
jgi:predicted P-loop ATPase